MGHVVPCMRIANFAIFNWNRRQSWKRYEIGPLFLWNVNRKSYVADQSVSIRVSSDDPEWPLTRGFKVMV